MDGSFLIECMRWVQHEMMLICLVFFTLGALDDGGFDLGYLWLRLTGRLRAPSPLPPPLPPSDAPPAPLAIFVPAWQEAEVLAPTLRRMQGAWGDDAYVIFIGCYHNDPDTIAAALNAIDFPQKARIFVNAEAGPTTKGDCLNRLWLAMQKEEQHAGVRFAGIVLHDAEDWVHPDELAVHRHYLPHHAMVQIPVVPFIPERGPDSGHWVAGHYADEFAEAHGKTLRVRHAMGGSLPAAGVGCAFDRDMMHFIAQDRGGRAFSKDSLVEDYELGLLIHSIGGRPVLAYHHDAKGALIATYSLFPTRIADSVRQKTRWLTGIALAGWDRMGWRGGIVEHWMRLHDRRSILAAFVMAMGYALMLLTVGLWMLDLWQVGMNGAAAQGLPIGDNPLVRNMATACAMMLLWRLMVRAWFSARLYGWRQGLWSVMRQPVANMVAIMAAWRAVLHYSRHCLGTPLAWDKTSHSAAEHGQVRRTADRQAAERAAP